MVTVVLINDKGQAYCWSSSPTDAMTCIESVRKGAVATYVNDYGKRLRYLCRAYEVIEATEATEKRP